ncbi:MAG: glycerol kinase GlpK [Arenicellales bacterium]|jgi:glycerol kinase|nr:glycerol kinase GlpK [Arenicellales bacterium]MDP6291337.1 glycerol kinase GlpK [Arenicellales bacterium]|tara:strand:- start:8586 stop:10082 length:1497 start_codon:yes stop_codon:yes gene_type:complete
MIQTPLLLAIDQGTTSSRAILFDSAGNALHVAQQEFTQHYPHDGWVEHDPQDIWSSTLAVTQEVLSQTQGTLASIGITNQRETTVVWDRASGEPIYNAIVWQDRRTADTCERLREAGHEVEVNARTGLLLDPYFCATKIAWILDHVEGARQSAEKGDLAFGTVDTFLLWRLTGGKVHATDATNASRTSLFNIHQQNWDETLLTLFNIPVSLLPQVKDSAADFGTTDTAVLGQSIAVGALVGDQQAALVGQACLAPGMLKSTYGTGCFAILNTGSEALASHHRLLTTIAYRLEGVATYALEGSIFVAGASVQWLRDELGLVDSANETATLAAGLDSNEGVYLVPAFTGLGAPYWNPHARGTLLGMTRATTPAHIARATLEAACYQSAELLGAMAEDSGQSPALLRIDGGMARNDWLAQFLADISDTLVERPALLETTALGAARLAGLQSGVFSSLDELGGLWRVERTFTPQMDESQRQALLNTWRRAVASAVLFAQPQD